MAGPRETKTVCRTSWSSRVRVWAPPPRSSPIAGPCTTLRVLTSTIRAQNEMALSGKSATGGRLMKQYVMKWRGRARELLISSAKLRKRTRTRSHRECCMRITNDHTRSEASVKHSLGFLGWCVNVNRTPTHVQMRTVSHNTY